MTAALRAHEARVAAMLADPDLVGDLLLVGLVFARAVDLGDPPLDVVVRVAAEQVYGQAMHGHHLALHVGEWRHNRQRIAERGKARVRDVLRSDIRRYAPDRGRETTCQRPTARRGEHLERYGELCARTADYYTREYVFTDPVDGTRHRLGACSRPLCRAWWQQLAERNRAELAANPAPEPVANRGGVLARHLDEIDWEALYAHLDPTWRPPHEAPGWRPPKLQILLGDNEPEPVTARSDRPALTVVKGGWR